MILGHDPWASSNETSMKQSGQEGKLVMIGHPDLVPRLAQKDKLIRMVLSFCSFLLPVDMPVGIALLSPPSPRPRSNVAP